MNILGVIPARYASTRFPGKPLADIAGKSMIRRVYEQSIKASSLNDVIVATDDERIYDHILGFGGKAVMTSPKHSTGTERCQEALHVYARTSDLPVEAVINIQGDEPFILPGDIDQVGQLLSAKGAEIATLVKKISKEEDLINPNVVKVVLNELSEAIYFSRSAIPFLRGYEPGQWVDRHTFYRHIGIYGYQSHILDKLPGLKSTSPEQAEALEQLRWIGHGLMIKTSVTDSESISIDTPSDLLKITNIT